MDNLDELLITTGPRSNMTPTCYNSLSTTARRYNLQSGKKNFSRCVNYAPDLAAYVEETENFHALEELVGVQWQVYQVSPLWNVRMVEDAREHVSAHGEVSGNENIQWRRDSREGVRVPQHYDERALKAYARIIQQYVSTDSEHCDRVDMEVVKGLRGAQSDCEALKITISSVMGSESRQILTGFLCGVETAELQLKSTNVINIPVLLLQGLAHTKDRVVFSLEKCFDCVIRPLHLPEQELMWMSAMWAGLEVKSLPNTGKEVEQLRKEVQPKKGKSKKVPLKDKTNTTEAAGEQEMEDSTADVEDSLTSKVMKLTFVPPASLGPEIREKIKHMTLEFPAAEIKQIWLALHREEDTEFTETEMKAFHASIRVHVRESLGLLLEKLELFQISLPFFKATQSGIVKMECPHHVKVVLRYLTEICQGDMLTAAPTLGHRVQTDDDTLDWNVTTGAVE